MAIRSTGGDRASLMISVAGSPIARTESTSNPSARSSCSSVREILAVLLHLFALLQFELLEISRRPAVGHVHQQQLRFRAAAPADGCAAGWFDRSRDFPPEQGLSYTCGAPPKNQPRKVCTSSQALSDAIMIAMNQARHFTVRPFDELAHLQLVAREHDQRKDREAQLQAQDHLAEHEQIRRALLASTCSSRSPPE